MVLFPLPLRHLWDSDWEDGNRTHFPIDDGRVVPGSMSPGIYTYVMADLRQQKKEFG
jgi:hypothetical protein